MGNTVTNSMIESSTDEIAPPQIKLGGLSLWVFGRQFPHLSDYWDGNWLMVKVRVTDFGAMVETSGPIIHGSELASFERELAEIERTLVGKAHLYCMEPELDVVLACGSLGQVEMVISITPNHIRQSHTFTIALDQTYLKPALNAVRQILLDYPLKGAPDDTDTESDIV